ncbi:Protein CBR-STR-162 [Caenorhabditis briggsae]|uniref:Seven TM Receptor n=2 Tax=Caenorhabditis briggsae TaxID=6238 RepID=A0AAE9AA68_CAEBR|nr:Protein CBR-STR-162 [Caenorhabditis briggsae]ULT93805.1 hypothetical protein L3Y34_003363 [Caenorhabditis briggsae]UMM27056.1 hypothetical protein L5515_010510 [Caenorhabditis briggsae]CAP20450.1 Protein CBR-STR-162 [Caenorhabditis briggsae]
MSMFVVHFVFRFFALQRRGNLKYFEDWYFLCWFAIPICLGILWAAAVQTFLHGDPESSGYMRETLLENYNLSISDIVYVGVLYHKKLANETTIMNLKGIQGVCILGAIMNICFILIIYFGALTYQRIKQLIMEGRSEYTRKLQKQLYQALVIQTIIPVFFMILPLTIYFFSPLFHLGHPIIGDLATFSCAMYPVLDPLPVMFVIDNYRLAILEGVGCIKRQGEVNVNVTSTSAI